MHSSFLLLSDPQNNTMVYYQSTPLIIKSEQPSQAQLCAPLRTVTEQQQHHQLSATSNTFILNNVAITTMQHHQQQQQQQQQQQLHQHQQLTHNINSTSITNHHQQQQQQHPHQQQQHQQKYLTNIKTELLPPGITLYATTQPASLTPLTTAGTTPSSSSSSSTSTNNVSSSTPTSTTSGVGGVGTVGGSGRKTNANKPTFKCEQCGMTFGSKSAHTSHTKSHVKNGDLSLMNGSTSSGANSPPTTMVELNEAGMPLGIPKTPQIKPIANAATNGGDPYQCNVCQKTFAVPARLVSPKREKINSF